MRGGVYQDGKSGRWYIQLRWQGKRERFFRYEANDQWFPFESRGHAKKVLSIMQGQVDDGIFRSEAWRPGSPLSIAQYSERWLSTLSNPKNTIRFYRSSIKYSIQYFGKEKDIRKIIYSDLMMLYRDLPLSDKSKYHALNTLKTMLKNAVRDGVLKKLPEFPKLSQGEDPDIEYLTFEEQQTVLNAIEGRDRYPIEFGMEFGLRIGELRALKKDCLAPIRVKTERGTVVVDGLVIKRSFSQNVLRETTKTGKKGKRELPMTTRAKGILQEAPPSFSDFLFTFDGRHPYYERKLRNAWKEACAKVGIVIELRKALRHSLGGQLSDMGVGMDMLKDIYGHTSEKTTRKYAKRTAISMLDALESRGKVVEMKGVKNDK